MNGFNFFLPTRIIFGPDSLNELDSTPHLPKGNKAMIMIGRTGNMLRLGYMGRVQGLLAENGVKSVIYDNVRANPESDQVEEAAEMARKLEADFIVGLGGGSSIDSAKATALLVRNPGQYWDYIPNGSGGGRELKNPALPVVAIPTVAGTGTEADPWCVITKSESREKIGFGNESTYPYLSIVDPKLTITVPSKMTAYTGMDAFFHAVETYLSKSGQPLTDTLALEAVSLINSYLPLAVEDGSNLDSRTVMSWASTAAGMCEALSRVISQHSLEHALSAFYPELPHGLGLVMISKAYFSHLADKADDDVSNRLNNLALCMSEDSGDFINALDSLVNAIGLGSDTLADYDISRDDIPALTKCAFDTMGHLFEVTPVDMTEEDVSNIFSQVLS